MERINWAGLGSPSPWEPCSGHREGKDQCTDWEVANEPVGCSPVSLSSPMFLTSHRCPSDPVLHIHARQPVIAGGGSMPLRPILPLSESVFAKLGVGSCDWIFSSS